MDIHITKEINKSWEVFYIIEKVREDYMEWIRNEENDWDHNVEGDAVGVVVCVSR